MDNKEIKNWLAMADYDLTTAKQMFNTESYEPTQDKILERENHPAVLMLVSSHVKFMLKWS